MKDNQFDDLMRERLQNHESSVPANMWERITENKKERKGGFVLRLTLLLAALAIFGLAGNYFFPHINSKNSKDVAFDKNDIKNTSASKERNKLKNTKNVSVRDVNTTKENRLGKSNSIRKDKRIRIPSFLQSKKEKWKAYHNQLTASNVSIKPVYSNGLTNHRKTPDYQDNNMDSLTKKLNKEKNIDNPVLTNKSAIKRDKIYNDKFSVEVFVSPDIPVNAISSADKAYEQVLKKMGKMQLSYTFGARIKYEITKKIAAKIGIQYTQINEKTALAQANNFTAANRYKSIDVPLLISYQTNWTSNLDLSVNAGINLNISSRYKGFIPSISGQVVDIAGNNVYEKNTGLALYLGIDLSKKVNRRTDIFAEPWFSYRLKNIANRSYPFNQKIHASGLSFGVRYRLFKNE